MQEMKGTPENMIRNLYRCLMTGKYDMVRKYLDVSVLLVYEETGRIVGGTNDVLKQLLKLGKDMNPVSYRAEARGCQAVCMKGVSNENRLMYFWDTKKQLVFCILYIKYSANGSPRVSVRTTGGEILCLRESSIYCVEALGKHAKLHLEQETIETRESFSKINSLLSNCFLQVHRSYTVNLQQVMRLKRYEMEMSGGMKIPVPEKKYNYIKTAMEAYCRESKMENRETK